MTDTVLEWNLKTMTINELYVCTLNMVKTLQSPMPKVSIDHASKALIEFNDELLIRQREHVDRLKRIERVC